MNEKIIKAIEKRVPEQWRKQFIENPERFIGPNYKAVINFWVFHDNLSVYQYSEVNRRWAKNDTRKKLKYSGHLRHLACDFYRSINSPCETKLFGYRYYSEELCSNILTLMTGFPTDDEIDILKIYENL